MTTTRRSRAAGGRPHRLTVWLSDAELAVVTASADRAGMAASAWLGESGVQVAESEMGTKAGLAGGAATAFEVMALRAELAEARRVLTNIGGNLNDVARHANSTGELHAGTVAVQALVARVVERVEATVGHVDQGMTAVFPRSRRRRGQRVVGQVGEVAVATESPRGHRGQSGSSDPSGHSGQARDGAERGQSPEVGGHGHGGGHTDQADRGPGSERS
jgi:hypothetical protein